MRNLPRSLSLPALLTASLLFIGCGDRDEIRAYTVPQPVTPKQPAASDTAASNAAGGNTAATKNPSPGTRLLAAIVPQGDSYWHFKLMGPTELVNTQAEAFTAFIEGIKFAKVKAEDGSEAVEPKWSLPKGWVQNPGTGMRYATIIIGERAHGMELTVFRLGPESGDVLANVQRWAGQVGVNNVTKAKLADFTKPVAVDNQTATLVDVTGPGGDSSMAGGPTKRPPTPPPSREPENLVAPTPEGWTKSDNPGQFLLAKYDLTKDGKTVSLTVSRAGGSPVANMNRWRQQIGLDPWDEAGAQKAFEGQKELREGEIAGQPAMLVDFVGPESAGETRESTVGALAMSRTGEFWFFKMRGPAALVAEHKATFDAFLKSVKFE